MTVNHQGLKLLPPLYCNFTCQAGHNPIVTERNRCCRLRRGIATGGMYHGPREQVPFRHLSERRCLPGVTHPMQRSCSHRIPPATSAWQMHHSKPQTAKYRMILKKCFEVSGSTSTWWNLFHLVSIHDRANLATSRASQLISEGLAVPSATVLMIILLQV